MNRVGRPLASFVVLLSIVVCFPGPGSTQTVTETQPQSSVEPAHDPAEDAAAFVVLVNQLRDELGLSPLALHPELVAEATAWTEVMATSGQLAHAGDITNNMTAPWTTLGENVGTHRRHEVDELFDAFVASPSHYQNLVDPRFQYIGVGVLHRDGGGLWTTHRFMAVADEPADAPAGPVMPPPHPYLVDGKRLIG